MRAQDSHFKAYRDEPNSRQNNKSVVCEVFKNIFLKVDFNVNRKSSVSQFSYHHSYNGGLCSYVNIAFCQEQETNLRK